MTTTAGTLVGRTVLVTGAASGIGRAIATGAHDDGAVVVGVDVDGEHLEPLAGERFLAHVADVADDEAVRAAVALAVDLTGRIDVVVNNAGIAGRGTVADMPAGLFERVMAVHTFSALYAMRAAIPHMRAAGHGRMVNVLSRGAEIPNPEGVAYSAAKSALFSLTRAVAQEVAGSGVLVNGLIPGPTNTAIWGEDRPELQAPEAVLPTARWLMTLPPDGPTGQVFWELEEYRLFHPDRNGGRGPQRTGG